MLIWCHHYSGIIINSTKLFCKVSSHQFLGVAVSVLMVLLLQTGFGLYPVVVKKFNTGLSHSQESNPLIFSFYRWASLLVCMCDIIPTLPPTQWHTGVPRPASMRAGGRETGEGSHYKGATSKWLVTQLLVCRSQSKLSLHEDHAVCLTDQELVDSHYTPPFYSHFLNEALEGKVWLFFLTSYP